MIQLERDLVGAVEEELGLWLIAGCEPGGGEVVVGESGAVGAGEEGVEVGDGLGLFAAASEGVGNEGRGDAAVGLELAGDGQLGEGFLIEFLQSEEEAEELVGGKKVGMDLEDAVALIDGLIVVAHEVEGPGERRLDAGRDGVEFGGVLHGGETFFAAAHAEEGVAIVLVGDGVVGVDGDGGLELALGAGPVPVVVGMDGEQGYVRFGERVIEGERFERGGLGAGISLSGRCEVVEALELIAAGAGGVGAGVAGIDEDGVVEQVDGFEEGSLGAAAGKELGLHVVAVGLGMSGIWCGGGSDGIGGELRQERVGDELGDGGLGGKDVGVVGVQGAGPEDGVGGAVDEANGDDEIVCGAMKIAGDDGLDFEAGAGCGGIGMGTEGGEHGGGGADGELVGGAELGGDGIGDAHTEVLILLLTGIGGEGKDGDGANGIEHGGVHSIRGGAVSSPLDDEGDGGQERDQEQRREPVERRIFGGRWKVVGEMRDRGRDWREGRWGWGRVEPIRRKGRRSGSQCPSGFR